jgi:predicted Zn finger-like uncharacterized protein
MHIVCPHCSTLYAVDVDTLGAAGRTVRCSRCKEVWLARPEDAVGRFAAEPAMAQAFPHSPEADAAEWEEITGEQADRDTPHVESPPLAGEWAENAAEEQAAEDDWNSLAGEDALDAEISRQQHPSWLARLFRRNPSSGAPAKPLISLPMACAGMGALLAALFVWRADMVRLLPQTATFYRMAGLEVNLRGVVFKDVKVSTETVEGKPVLVIEGVIVGETKKPVDLPRLRFSVRDAQGTEIYAWNSVLEQKVLKPGDRAWFKSRLASPPPEGRQIDIRFFNKRDIAGSSA